MKPFQILRRADRVELWLDTPHASLNVFGPAAAEQLVDVLQSLSPSRVRWLLLRTRKPGSFVNGAGLLYAAAMKSSQAAASVSAPVRAAYALLAQCPIPTLAVVEGNCYGCGLELALCCKYRVARDSFDTQFRMTELSDYRFIPLFGGTWRLPRQVGASAAAELLLDGATFSAQKARKVGLVDAVFSGSTFDSQLESFLSRPRSRVFRGDRKSLDPFVERAVPRKRPLWKQAAKLLARAATVSDEEAARAELTAFAQTVTGADAKNAMAFFFLRHMARTASLGTSERRMPRADVSAPSPRVLAKILSDRRPRFAGKKRIALGTDVTLGPEAGRIVLWFIHGERHGLVEVALAADASAEEKEMARDVAVSLEWMGFEPILTAPRNAPLFRRLLQAWIASGGMDVRMREALGRFGFDADVSGVAKRWRVTGVRKTGRPTVETCIRAVAEEGSRALQDGTVQHSTQVDLCARLLLGFPLEEVSLSRYVARRLKRK